LFGEFPSRPLSHSYGEAGPLSYYVASTRSIGRDANATRRWFQFSGCSALLTDHQSRLTTVARAWGEFSALGQFSVLG